METQVCVQCNQGITNPICSSCHTKQLSVWLKDNNLASQMIFVIIKKVKTTLDNSFGNKNHCIICRKENLSFCTYCYFLKVDEVLHSLNLSDETIEEFIEIFNYNLYGDDSFSIRDYKKFINQQFNFS